MTVTYPKSKRRKMKRFVIEEISIVDKPAQKGALLTIMKRDDGSIKEHVGGTIRKAGQIPTESESAAGALARQSAGVSSTAATQTNYTPRQLSGPTEEEREDLPKQPKTPSAIPRGTTG